MQIRTAHTLTPQRLRLTSLVFFGPGGGGARRCALRCGPNRIEAPERATALGLRPVSHSLSSILLSPTTARTRRQAPARSAG